MSRHRKVVRREQLYNGETLIVMTRRRKQYKNILKRDVLIIRDCQSLIAGVDAGFFGRSL